jgi:thiol-disulfide isomerase/thioredoxin
MKAPHLVLLALALALTACLPRGPHPLTGQPLPETRLATLEGQNKTLPIEGNPPVQLVQFWASWCGPCRYTMPMLTDLASEFADQGLVTAAVNQGEPVETVAKYVQGKAIAPYVLLDTNLAAGARYQVRSLPTIMLLDRHGVVQFVYVGYSGSLHNELRNDIQTLLREANDA